MVAEHIGLDFLRIGHCKYAIGAADRSFIAHLAAAFGVKRRRRQHHHAALAGGQFVDLRTIQVQSQHGAALAKVLVANKFITGAAVLQAPVLLELACRAGLGFLALHGGAKAFGVNRQAALSADVGR